eukprot:COSAG06_NODE_2281_length_7180_cov_49.556701_3_plen_254_part_00
MFTTDQQARQPPPVETESEAAPDAQPDDTRCAATSPNLVAGGSDADVVSSRTSEASRSTPYVNLYLARRTLSPPTVLAEHTLDSTSTCVHTASWDDAPGGENESWVHNATLTDPCFHHPCSPLARTVRTTIDEDAEQLRLSAPVSIITGNRRRPHRGAAPTLPAASAELSLAGEGMKEETETETIFHLDEDRSATAAKKAVKTNTEESTVAQPSFGMLPAPAAAAAAAAAAVTCESGASGLPASPVFTPLDLM